MKYKANDSSKDKLDLLNVFFSESLCTEAYLEPSQTCTMKFFAKIVNSF